MLMHGSMATEVTRTD